MPTHAGGNAVEHPPHYNAHPAGVECIEIVEHMPFNIGNAVKYLWRADHKHAVPIEDLKKAVWYIEREIERRSPRAEPSSSFDVIDVEDNIPVIPQH